MSHSENAQILGKSATWALDVRLEHVLLCVSFLKGKNSTERLKDDPAGVLREGENECWWEFSPLFFVPGPIFSKGRKGKMITLHGLSQNCLLLIIPLHFCVMG